MRGISGKEIKGLVPAPHLIGDCKSIAWALCILLAINI